MRNAWTVYLMSAMRVFVYTFEHDHKNFCLFKLSENNFPITQNQYWLPPSRRSCCCLLVARLLITPRGPSADWPVEIMQALSESHFHLSDTYKIRSKAIHELTVNSLSLSPLLGNVLFSHSTHEQDFY